MGQSEYFGSPLVFLFQRSLFWIIFFCSLFFLSRTTSRRALGLALAYRRYTYHICLSRDPPVTQRQVGRDERARAIGREKWNKSDWQIPSNAVRTCWHCCLLLIYWCCSWCCIGQWRYCYCWCCCCCCSCCCCCRCCSCCCNCRRRCYAFINFCYGYLPSDKTCFFFFWFFSFFGGRALPFMILYEFRLNRFDPSIVVDRPCALLAFREWKKDRTRLRRSTSAAFLFLGR